jgi:uncharacterized membrane protein YwaF
MSEVDSEIKVVLATTGVLMACVIVVGISYSVSPIKPDLSLARGGILPTISWLTAAFCTAMVIILSMPLLILACMAKSGSSGIITFVSFAFVVAVLVLLLDIAQLLSAL